MILAATNRPETLDKGSFEIGPFRQKNSVELPDLKGREAILRVHGKMSRWMSPLTLTPSRATVGSSGAELANIINEARSVPSAWDAALYPRLASGESVETVIAGYQKKKCVRF